MSQESLNFSSIRRPRETLSNIQSNSTSIPQPSSVLKRTSTAANFANPPFSSQHARSQGPVRQSFGVSVNRPPPAFGRMSVSGNMGMGADGGLSSVRRSVAPNNMFHSSQASRPSHVPASMPPPPPPPMQRRSSVFSRQSVAANGGHHSFFTQAPPPAAVPRDPRPLKDRGYQARIAKELLDYLTYNNFELEMKHPLSQNTLRSPTQKDFNYIFQWLYHRIDPSYKFLKSIDAEVPPILRQLRYPFDKSITKSQLAAVGGQNWSTFLGMLHWLMQLAQMLDRYSVGAYDDICAEAGVDVAGDRIIFNFLTGAYQDWLQGGEDEDDEVAEKRLIPHIETMAASFAQGNERFIQEEQALAEENENLKRQLEDLEKNAPDLNELESNFEILEEDKKKFEHYDKVTRGKISRYEHRIKSFDEKHAETKADLTKAEEERLSLRNRVDQQGISIQDIDRMNTEQERLQRSYDDLLVKVQEAHNRMLERENEVNRRLEDLEELVKSYNTIGYQTGVIPPTAVNAKNVDYEVQLNLNENSFPSSNTRSESGSPAETDRLLADANTGYSPRHLIRLDLRGNVRNAFLALRKEVNERRKATLDADMNHRDLLDNIKEAMDEKHGEVAALEHKRRAAEEEFEKIKDTTTTQKLASDAQIEKMESELAKMRSALTDNIQLLEQREMNIHIEHEQLVLRANTLREELHTGIENMLNDVIRFKVHIQKGLEDYEGFVVDVAEEELGEVASGEGEGDYASTELETS